MKPESALQLHLLSSFDDSADHRQLAPLANVQPWLPILADELRRPPSPHSSHVSRRLIRSAETNTVTSTRCAATSSRAPSHHDPQTSHRRQPVRIFKFVHVHESSGKVDEATGAQIRSHLAGEFHRKRRKDDTSSKNQSPTTESTSLPVQSRSSVQKHVRKFSETSRVQARGSQAHWDRSKVYKPLYLTDPGGIGHHDFPRQYADPNTAGANMSQVRSSSCRSLTSRPSQSQGIAHLTSPPTNLREFANTGCFDPFASSAIPLTDRMPEFIRFCKSPSTLVTYIRETSDWNHVYEQGWTSSLR